MVKTLTIMLFALTLLLPLSSALIKIGGGTPFSSSVTSNVELNSTSSSLFDNAIGQCVAGQFVYGFNTNGVKLCATPSGSSGGGNTSGANPYLYNDTTTIYGNSSYINATYPEKRIFNSTQFLSTTSNITVSESWLNTFLSTLFYPKSSNPLSYWNDTYATFNKTYADTLYASISTISDNTSWNQTHANTLYKPIGIQTWNDTYATFNKTYADTLYASISTVTDNASWNQTYANTLYKAIGVQTWNSTFANYNKTYGDSLYVNITGGNVTGNLNVTANISVSQRICLVQANCTSGYIYWNSTDNSVRIKA